MSKEHVSSYKLDSDLRYRIFYEIISARLFARLLNENFFVEPQLVKKFLNNLKYRFWYLARAFTEGKFNQSNYYKVVINPNTIYDSIEDIWNIQLLRKLATFVRLSHESLDVIGDFDKWRIYDPSIPDVISLLFEDPQVFQSSILSIASHSSDYARQIRNSLDPFMRNIKDRYGGVCILTNFASGLADAGFLHYWFNCLYPNCKVLQAIVRYSPIKEGDMGCHIPPTEKGLLDQAIKLGYPFLFVDHFSASGSTVDEFYHFVGEGTPAFAAISHLTVDGSTINELADKHQMDVDILMAEGNSSFSLFIRH